jgi:hypothetical protein
MLKTATTILLIGMLFATLYSVAVVVSPQTIAQSTLKATVGIGLEAVQDRGVAETLVAQTRHLGIFALTTNIALFFILFVGFKKGQRWAWWAFFFAGGIAWIFGLVTEILEKDMMNTIGHCIGTLLWLVGLLLAVKVFFPKKA